jgi:hypothetical protein
MDFEIQRTKFVNDKMTLLIEKEYEKKKKILEIQNEIKTSGILIEYLKEKIEFVYKYKKLDTNQKVSSYDLINDFVKWCDEVHSKKFDIDNYYIKEIFKSSEFLGEMTDDDNWLGLKFK